MIGTFDLGNVTFIKIGRVSSTQLAGQRAVPFFIDTMSFLVERAIKHHTESNLCRRPSIIVRLVVVRAEGHFRKSGRYSLGKTHTANILSGG